MPSLSHYPSPSLSPCLFFSFPFPVAPIRNQKTTRRDIYLFIFRSLHGYRNPKTVIPRDSSVPGRRHSPSIRSWSRAVVRSARTIEFLFIVVHDRPSFLRKKNKENLHVNTNVSNVANMFYVYIFFFLQGTQRIQGDRSGARRSLSRKIFVVFFLFRKILETTDSNAIELPPLC